MIGWALTALIGLALLLSSFMKIAGGEEVAKNAAAIGLGAGAIKLIGVLEVLCLVFFIVPRTGVLGTLLVAAYLGGAIVTHLEHQQPFLAPLLIQCLVFIAAAIRFPELGKRLFGKTV